MGGNHCLPLFLKGKANEKQIFIKFRHEHH